MRLRCRRTTVFAALASLFLVSALVAHGEVTVGSEGSVETPSDPLLPTLSAPNSTLRLVSPSALPSIQANTSSPSPPAFIELNETTPINISNLSVGVAKSPSQPTTITQVIESEMTQMLMEEQDYPHDAYSLLSYISSSIAFVVLILALGLHFIAAEASSQGPTFTTPNQWELLVYITYLQSMASTAHYVITAVPSILWDFVDVFSWTSLIPVHGKESGNSMFDDPTRQLNDSFVLDGLPAFAGRVGILEPQLLQETAAGCIVGMIILFLVGVVVVFYVRIFRDGAFDSPRELPSDLSDRESHELAAQTVDIDGVPQSRRPILIVQGITVVFLVFSFYPVTLMAFYEIVTQIRTKDTQTGSLMIALLSLIPGSGLFMIQTLAYVRKTDQARKYVYGYRMVWGSLNSPNVVKCDRRVHFVMAWFAVQITSALVIAAVQSDVWQLISLIAIDGVAILGIVIGRPFVHDLLKWIGIGLFVLKAINTALAFAFLGDGQTSTPKHHTIASVFVFLNVSILVLWWLRLAWIACRVIRVCRIQVPRKDTVGLPTLTPLARSSSNGSRHFVVYSTSIKDNVNR